MEEAVIQIPEMPTLSVIPAGKLPPHPSELLGGPMASECIRRWRADYDHVIIDTPPLLSVTDALLLSVKADSTVFIVRAGRTSTVALRRSRNLLASMHVHVMGSVLNAIDLSSPDHYHYYYSGYSGGYYSQLEPVAETQAEKAQAEMSRRV
jgi:succinoglycan biosynthesis transport protein ExoP